MNPLRLATLFIISYSTHAEEEAPGMVKMCLFYPNESGHARSDPILNQNAPSDHVHTFYGPQNFHPDTSYEQLRRTKPGFSSSPFEENQSLYWHPSIYRKLRENNKTVYRLVNNLETSPYYRWNTDTSPKTVEFPPEFRMIAFSDQENADSGGETGGNLLVECCNFRNNGEECTTTEGNPLIFPTKKCDFLGLAFAMPTCWDESKGIGTVDPIGHVAYTTDGTVGGPCPAGYNNRIPQVQLFVRINNYEGGIYQLSDGNDVFHVDFMNGWEEGKLTQIMNGCEPSGETGYNPPCDCDQFLTETNSPAKAVCDSEVRKYIIDELIDEVAVLPRASNSDADVIPKSWGENEDPPFNCNEEENDDDGEEEENDDDEDGSNDDEEDDDDEEGSDDEEEDNDDEEGSDDEEEDDDDEEGSDDEEEDDDDEDGSDDEEEEDDDEDGSGDEEEDDDEEDGSNDIEYRCKKWCYKNKQPWEKKCNWINCRCPDECGDE